jgi:hypothetical protein
MNRVAAASPEVFQEQMEPLHRMVVSYGTEINAADDHEGSTVD